MLEELTDAINVQIEDMNNKIDRIVQLQYPILLSQLAKEIFDSKGKTHGRNWDGNKPSTIKRKGFDHRNVETGLLETTLEQPGFLVDDDYMFHLPDAKGNHGYKFANSYAPFDDIGRTSNDEDWINTRLAEEIQNDFK